MTLWTSSWAYCVVRWNHFLPGPQILSIAIKLRSNRSQLNTRIPRSSSGSASASMKIALIVPGGVDRSGRILVIPVLLALIERLARRHKVVVVSLDPNAEPSQYELLGARVVNLGLTKARTYLSWTTVTLGRVMSALRVAGGGFDLLHAFWVFPQGTIAVAAGALLRIPVVVSVGGGELVWLPTIHYGGMRTLRSRITMSATLRTASAVSGPSRYVTRAAKQFAPTFSGSRLAWTQQFSRDRSSALPARPGACCRLQG